MAFKKKTWTDRMVEYAGRRKLTNVSTKQAVIYDVERSEGTVSKEGDAFSSQNMNDLEQRVADGFSEVKQTTDGLIQNLDGAKIIHEGSGAATKYYAQLGADAASKKLLGNTPCYIKTWTGGNGGVQTINIPISDYPDYQQLSANNFKAGVTSLQGAMGQGWINGITDYNANTGVVTISYANHGSAALTGFLAISSAGFTDL